LSEIDFEWDPAKDSNNSQKHNVSFKEAKFAFYDQNRVIARDLKNSTALETRYFCFGLNKEKTGIITVRFTYRSGKIRIFGAGYWRRGKRLYEQHNQLY
jgi:uncharacterized DUF497 family protein